MKINYCLPVIKKTKKDVLDTVSKYRNEYQYLEIWLDGVKDMDLPFVDKLIYMLQDKLILLFLRGNVMKTNITKETKIRILDLLDGSQSFIDLDLSEKEELDFVKKRNIRMIVSYHNYKETPVDPGEIIKQMDKLHPAIYKIATRCKNEMDGIKLLLLEQNLKAQNKRHIVLGMGEFGTITRVFGTLWGNELIYAPKNVSEQSADGQLTKDQLEKIFENLSE
jgi:3-dehydroquinate dehydratase type I